MPLVLPVRGQANWDVTNNAALQYLDSYIQTVESQIGQTTGALLAANNLSDLASASTARTNLGLGSAATASTSAFDTFGSATTAQANAAAYTDAQLSAEVTRADNTYAKFRADVFDVTKYGAKGDGQVVIDGAITAGQNILGSPQGRFVAGDVGKHIMIKGAGTSAGFTLSAVISTYNSPTSVTINTNAVTTVTNALVMWGTDDTAAIQSAINAAGTYASTHGTATVFFPNSTGLFYAVAGPLVHTGSGNSQLYLPVNAPANSKINLIFLGVGNGSVVQHWLQQTPVFNGSTLLSFGSYANSTIQDTDVTANGNGCVIGGPTQPNGYGTSALLFNNISATFQDMSILVPHTMGGISYSAGDMSGIANCDLIDFAYGSAGTVPSGDYQNVNLYSSGLSIGWLMPANGNNDNCVVQNVTCHGGFVFGFFMTEHTVINAMRILYSWSGLCAIGSYFGSGGASHAMWVNQISIEGCAIELNIFGQGASGYGPFINIDQLDTEHGNPTFADRSSGTALSTALGTIRLTGLYNGDNVTVNGPTGLKIIDGQKSVAVRSVSANYTTKVTDEIIYVNASSGPVEIDLISAQWTPNVYTVIKEDSSANAVTVKAQSGQTIIGPLGGGTQSAALTTQYAKIKVAPQGGIATNWYEV